MSKSLYNRKKKQELGIPDLIAVLLPTVALWYFIYQEIIYLSSEDYLNDTILSLIVTHGLLSANVCFILIVINSRLRSKVIGNLFIISEKSEQYLKGLWLPITLFCLVSFIIASFRIQIEEKYSLLLNIGVSLFIVFSIFKKIYHLGVISFFQRNYKDAIIWLFILVFILSFHAILLSSISAKVKIVFHREIFINENVTFSLSRRGYIFPPQISGIELNKNYQIHPINNLYYKLEKDSVDWNNGLNYLEVKYYNQITRFKYSKYVEVPYLR